MGPGQLGGPGAGLGVKGEQPGWSDSQAHGSSLAIFRRAAVRREMVQVALS